jgi:hypothetical protein
LGTTKEIDRSKVVLLVVEDDECLLLVPPEINRDTLIDSLQAALQEVLSNSSNVIRFDNDDVN